MRTLSLLRHAKSSWENERLADFERPLAPRGEKAAALMGQHMREIGLSPDLVVCSSAVRTRETAALALAAAGLSGRSIIYDDEIYEATAHTLLARLSRLDRDIRHALIIGHNPGLQRLVLALAGGGLAGGAAEIAEKLPTGALVVLDLDLDDWASLREGCGAVTHYATPRRLQEQ
ncbi:MAG: histidine phosphatase family protein [Hyphomicrobiaceae bacterium]